MKKKPQTQIYRNKQEDAWKTIRLYQTKREVSVIKMDIDKRQAKNGPLR